MSHTNVPEPSVGGWGGVGWGLHSHYIVNPNLVLRLDWGFDNTKMLQWLQLLERITKDVQPISANIVNTVELGNSSKYQQIR